MWSFMSSMRAAVLLLTASLLLVTSSAGGHMAAAETKAGHSASKRTKVSTVLIAGFEYQPKTITVKLGQTVQWTNNDIVPHTATSVAAQGVAAFDSNTILAGASWRFVVAKKGSYEYFCTLHPNMKATLRVQ